MRPNFAVKVRCLSVALAVGLALPTFGNILTEITSEFDGTVKSVTLTKYGNYYYKTISSAEDSFSGYTAQDKDGYRFLGWYTLPSDKTGMPVSPTECSNGPIETSKSISKNTILGNCKRNGSTTLDYYVLCPKYVKVYTISVSVSPANAGTVSGGGSCDEGASVTISATANTGWTFSNWTKSGATVSTDASYSFMASSSTAGDYVANFTQKSYSVTFHDSSNTFPDDKQSVTHEGSATAPNWERKGYSLEWDKAFNNITADLTVTASWIPNTYIIEYDLQGGSHGGKVVEQSEVDVIWSVSNPTSGGKTFSGWKLLNYGDVDYSEAKWGKGSSGVVTVIDDESVVCYNENGSVYFKNLTMENNGKVKLQAQWGVNEYSLTIYPNGNGAKYNGSTDNTTLNEHLISGATNLNELAVSTRDGYAFIGYFDASSGGTMVYDANGHNVKGGYWTDDYPNGTFKGEKNLNVYAHWSHNTTTITLNPDGGSGDPFKVTAEYESDMPKLINFEPPTKKGYDFAGYWSDRGVSGTQYYNADGTSANKWNRTDSTYTLYAHWSAHKYTMEYDLDGGKFESGNAPNETTYDKYFYVSAPVRDGAKFIGWQVIGSDVDYGTAKCGNGPSSIQTVIESGEQLCVNGEKGSVYFLNLTPKNGGWVTLKANWDVARYTLTIDPNGGYYNDQGEYYRATDAFDFGYESLIFGETNCNRIGTCVRAGYDFKGYKYNTSFVYDEHGQNKVCDWWSDNYPNGTFRGAANLKITANWVEHEYRITLDAQGGEGGTQSIAATLHGSMQKIEVPTRDGYVFSGYFTQKNGAGDKYYDEDGESVRNWDKEKDTTLYALWEAIEYWIGFDGNGVDDLTGTMTNIGPVKYDQAIELTPNAFTNGMLSFKGWKGADGKHYDDRAMVSNLTTEADAIFMMTADWGGEYLVIFNGNGATNTVMEAQELEREVPAKLHTNEYEKVGYTFTGWAKSQAAADALEVSYKDGESVLNITEAGGTAELYAVWKTNEYTVTFDLNSGRWKYEGANPRSCVYDQQWPIPEEEPTHTNELYRFNGWGCETTGKTYNEGEMVSNLTAEANGNVTLKAQWVYDVGPYSEALGCTNLVFRLPDGDEVWKAAFNEPEGDSMATSMKHSKVGNDRLVASIMTTGVLSFEWCASSKNLTLYLNNGTNFISTTGNAWTKETVLINDASITEISFTTTAPNNQSIWIANLTWTPGEAPHPVPGPGDEAVICMAAVQDGRFDMAFSNKQQFAYEIWTNSNIAVPNGWALKDVTNSTEEVIIFSPEIDPAVPTMFYKVKTIQRP